MTSSTESKHILPDATDEAVAAYRSVSGLAVGGFLLGLISPLALYGPSVWIVPALGIIACLRALSLIRASEGALAGAWLAYLGLPLCAFFLSAGVARASADRHYLLRSADQVAQAFFRDLRHNDPHRAIQWQSAAPHRHALDDLLWDYFRQDEKKAKQLREFVERPPIKTLLLLGERADIRLYQTVELKIGDTQDALVRVYAVTFDDAGEKKTYFMQVDFIRESDYGGPVKHWRVRDVLAALRPPKSRP